MRVGVMRRGLAIVVVAVLGVVMVTSVLTHKASVTNDPISVFGLRVAHPLQMKSVPADLIPIP
jgi:hypothetical protein